MKKRISILLAIAMLVNIVCSFSIATAEGTVPDYYEIEATFDDFEADYSGIASLDDAALLDFTERTGLSLIFGGYWTKQIPAGTKVEDGILYVTSESNGLGSAAAGGTYRNGQLKANLLEGLEAGTVTVEMVLADAPYPGVEGAAVRAQFLRAESNTGNSGFAYTDVNGDREDTAIDVLLGEQEQYVLKLEATRESADAPWKVYKYGLKADGSAQNLSASSDLAGDTLDSLFLVNATVGNANAVEATTVAIDSIKITVAKPGASAPTPTPEPTATPEPTPTPTPEPTAVPDYYEVEESFDGFTEDFSQKADAASFNEATGLYLNATAYGSWPKFFANGTKVEGGVLTLTAEQNYSTTDYAQAGVTKVHNSAWLDYVMPEGFEAGTVTIELVVGAPEGNRLQFFNAYNEAGTAGVTNAMYTHVGDGSGNDDNLDLLAKPGEDGYYHLKAVVSRENTADQWSLTAIDTVGDVPLKAEQKFDGTSLSKVRIIGAQANAGVANVDVHEVKITVAKPGAEPTPEPTATPTPEPTATPSPTPVPDYLEFTETFDGFTEDYSELTSADGYIASFAEKTAFDLLYGGYYNTKAVPNGTKVEDGKLYLTSEGNETTYRTSILEYVLPAGFEAGTAIVEVTLAGEPTGTNQRAQFFNAYSASANTGFGYTHTNSGAEGNDLGALLGEQETYVLKLEASRATAEDAWKVYRYGLKADGTGQNLVASATLAGGNLSKVRIAAAVINSAGQVENTEIAIEEIKVIVAKPGAEPTPEPTATPTPEPTATPAPTPLPDYYEFTESFDGFTADYSEMVSNDKKIASFAENTAFDLGYSGFYASNAMPNGTKVADGKLYLTSESNDLPSTDGGIYRASNLNYYLPEGFTVGTVIVETKVVGEPTGTNPRATFFNTYGMSGSTKVQSGVSYTHTNAGRADNDLSFHLGEKEVYYFRTVVSRLSEDEDWSVCTYEVEECRDLADMRKLTADTLSYVNIANALITNAGEIANTEIVIDEIKVIIARPGFEPEPTPEPTATPEPTPEATATPEPEEGYPMGDVNNDGSWDAKDALLILQIGGGKYEASEIEMEAGDVNNDGAWDAKDALKVLQFGGGKITTWE